MTTNIQQMPYGTTRDGRAVQRFILQNKNGLRVELTDYGARILSIRTPDRRGDLAEITLGYDSLAEYERDAAYLGCTVGRFAGRIAGAQFELNGKLYHLQANDGKNCLHGGFDGLHRVVWDADALEESDGASVAFRHTSPHGAGGFPGTLELQVTYRLDENDALGIDYQARSDRDTVLNLTNHAYFNLSGDPAQDILRHDMQIFSEHFIPIDAELIPTGEIRPVQGTVLDFRTPHAIGARIDAEEPQLRLAGGYDHTWVLQHPSGGLDLAARVVEPESGRVLEVLATQPGIVFYSGNMLDERVRGRNGIPFFKRHAFCLEAQHFPDSPNHANFPSTLLSPDETYSQRTVYRFSVAP